MSCLRCRPREKDPFAGCMSLLFDANLSPKLVHSLLAEFPGSRHVRELSLSASDKEIWEFSIVHNLTIVTKDSDFDTLSLLLAPPGKVIRITLGNCASEPVSLLLKSYHSIISLFISDSAETLLILPLDDGSLK